MLGGVEGQLVAHRLGCFAAVHEQEQDTASQQESAACMLGGVEGQFVAHQLGCFAAKSRARRGKPARATQTQ
jgi:predicted alpha/beta hydrolase family esterase